jgi:CRISPR-associated exonuclease Cas4
MTSVSAPLLALMVGAAVVLGVSVYALLRARRSRRRGELVWADVGNAGRTLYSDRYELYGRPDEVRRLGDGTLIPVEIKSRSAPLGGVPRSHRIQVGAYCLLLEESREATPPYGIVRYAGGTELKVPFGNPLRNEVLEVRAAVERTYRGEATPSSARCRRCPWRTVCDQAV